jgi:uncharacterized membrane protein YdbT with pleckstrin-like domain
MGGRLWRILTDPAVEPRLREGEYEVDRVSKHWVAYWRVIAEVAAFVVCCLLYLNSTVAAGWVFAWLAGAVLVHALWLFACLQSDVFVITNRRVFRIQGPVGRKFATLPATRIVDYSVNQSVLGRLCGYGHFYFESAGQDQALHEIRFVSDPTGRSDKIQDVVQPVEVPAEAPGGAGD